MEVDPFNDNAVAAASYAEMGWMVFPLHSFASGRCTCGRADCSSPAKHPRLSNGLKGASREPAMIAEWWDRWPDANVGVVTGEQSGIVVLDIDADKGGHAGLDDLTATYGPLNQTAEAETGGGGKHYVYAHPGKPIRNSNSKIRPGIDIRADGGYIVAPPSIHASGNRYRWRLHPMDGKPASFPDWLYAEATVATPTATPEPAKRLPVTEQSDPVAYWIDRALAKARNGNRNETGFWLACQLRDAKMSLSTVTTALREYSRRCPAGDKPYTEREAEATAKSAFAESARDPAKSRSATSNHTSKPQQQKPIEPTQIEVVPGDSYAASELSEYLNDIITGKAVNIPWPWKQLTKLACALIPGTVTLLCGDPGVGKTFLVLQCVEFWDRMKIPCRAFFIEKDRKFHTRRLLAQLMNDGHFCDYDWIKFNGPTVKQAMETHANRINQLGTYLDSALENNVTIDSLLVWIQERFEQGCRVLVIDPITAADAGQNRWEADQKFMLKAQALATKHRASIVVITHPRSAKRVGAATANDMAGGGAYYKFADNVIWTVKKKEPEYLRVKTRNNAMNLPEEKVVEAGIVFQLHKAREGIGQGQQIAYTFENLLYTEHGVVIGKAEKDQE